MIRFEDNRNIGYSKIILTGDTPNRLIEIIRWLQDNDIPLAQFKTEKYYAVHINHTSFDVEHIVVATKTLSDEKRMLFKLTFS